MRLAAAWATDVGQIRGGNEDSLLIDDRLGVFAIADGMGGHRGGEVASSTAVEAVRVAMANGASIDTAIQSANAAIRERAVGDPDVTGMGTTFTAIVPLDDANVLIGHVGDSRAYLARSGTLRRLTRDHSLVEDLVREGRITRDQADVHPQRSIITRALGIEPEIEVDLYTVRVAKDDRLLICSDGLTDMLSEDEVARIATDVVDGSEAAHALIDAANAAGGIDNITVVLLDVTDVEDGDEDFIDHGAEFAGPTLTTSTAPEVGPGPNADIHRDLATTAALSSRGFWHLTRSSVRALLVVVPLVMIVAIAFGVVWYRASHTYFVTQLNGEVVIQRGVPGGILWIEPTTDEFTGLKTGTLTPAGRLRIGDGFCESSTRAGARRCVEDLVTERLQAQSTTTTQPSTSTTEPAATTTPTTGAPPTSRAPVTGRTTAP
jgi:protein phosphatase